MSMTDFYNAVVTDDLALLNQLLTAGFDVNQNSETGATPLILVAGQGKVGFVKLLIEHGADIEAKHRMNGQTALHVACAEARLKVVRLLLAAGANPNVKSDHEQSPLAISLVHDERKYVPIVTELLRYHADPNEQKYESNLMLASANSNPDCVKALIDAGASVNEASPCGTALTNAIIYKKYRNMETLLEHGADPFVPIPINSIEEKISGKNAFEIAEMVKNRRAIALLRENRRRES
jgi:ankyrin repeat protein